VWIWNIYKALYWLAEEEEGREGGLRGRKEEKSYM
jgi:hypothetical protein